MNLQKKKLPDYFNFGTKGDKKTKLGLLVLSLLCLLGSTCNPGSEANVVNVPLEKIFINGLDFVTSGKGAVYIDTERLHKTLADKSGGDFYPWRLTEWGRSEVAASTNAVYTLRFTNDKTELYSSKNQKSEANILVIVEVPKETYDKYKGKNMTSEELILFLKEEQNYKIRKTLTTYPDINLEEARTEADEYKLYGEFLEKTKTYSSETTNGVMTVYNEDDVYNANEKQKEIMDFQVYYDTRGFNIFQLVDFMHSQGRLDGKKYFFLQDGEKYFFLRE